MPTRYVALFRGINVGRAKRVAMADLRKVLGSLGFANVTTLLNSGNVVFDGPNEKPPEIAARIRAAVAKKLCVDAFVVVKTADDVAAIVAGNKLGKTASDPSRLLVAVTADAPSLSKLVGAEVQVGKHAAYVWCANGILGSKAATALLKSLHESGTTRNWATIQKLDALLKR